VLVGAGCFSGCLVGDSLDCSKVQTSIAEVSAFIGYPSGLMEECWLGLAPVSSTSGK